MSTSRTPAAAVHPGAVRAIFDHLIIALTADGQPGPPTFLFSHYRFRWADDGVGGGGAAVRERVMFDRHAIQVEWTRLAAPIFASGPAPRVPTEDIVSVLVEAGAATATMNDAALPGRPFANDAWVAWLGRPLSSAVVAIGEVLLARP